MKRSLRRFKNMRGFTLVELIVVLVLITLVSAIAVPSYLGYVDDTHEKQCEMNMKSLVSYLDDARAMSSSVTMQEIIDEHFGEDADLRLECPSGVKYVPLANDSGVRCEKHGIEVVVSSRSENRVTADVKSGTIEEPAPPVTEEKKPENNAGSGSGSETEAQPTLTVTVSPNPLECTEGAGNQTLTAAFAESGGSVDSITIAWTSSDESVAKVTGGNGSTTATIQIVGPGECQITCTATAYSPNRTKTQTSSGEATVKVKKAPVELALTVNPSSATIKKGETVSLNASVSAGVVCNYQWSVPDNSGVSLSNTSGANIVATGVKAGSTTVTCTATPTDTSIILAEGSGRAQATVTVEGEKTIVSKDEIIIKGWNEDSVNATLDATAYGLPTGGVWSAASDDVSFPYKNSGYVVVEDNKSGGTYHISYTTDDTIYNFDLKVVYEVYENGFGISETSIDILLGDEKEIWASVNPYFATCANNIEWTNSATAVVSLEKQGEDSNYNYFYRDRYKVKGLSVGTTTISASLYDSVSGRSFSKSCTINVKYKPITAISFETITLQEGQSVELKDYCTFVPSEGIDTDAVNFEGWFSSIAEVSDGKLFAKKAGTETGKIQIKGTSISADCTVIVTPDPKKLTGITLDPSTIDIMQGETIAVSLDSGDGKVKIHPDPVTASLEGAQIKCSIYSDWNLEILNDVNIKGKNVGDNIPVSVTATKDGNSYTAHLTVNVKQDPSGLKSIAANDMQMKLDDPEREIQIWTDPQGIDMSSLTFRYSGYDETCIQINGNKVKPLKQGSTTVTVEALANDGRVLAKCTFNVVVSNININNFYIDPAAVELKVGETKSVEIKYDSQGDTSDLTFDIVDYKEEQLGSGVNDALDIVFDGTKITFTGKKTMGNTRFIVRAKVGDSVLARSWVSVQVYAIKSMNIKPDMIVLAKGESRTVSIELDPPYEELKNVSLKINNYTSDIKMVDNNNGTVTVTGIAESNTWPSICVLTDNARIEKQLQVIVTEEKQLRGFRVIPENINIQKGESAYITVYPNMYGDAVIYPEPLSADLTNVKFSYMSDGADGVSVTEDGIITGKAVAEHTIWITASGGKDYIPNKGVKVKVTEKTAKKMPEDVVEIDGHSFEALNWEQFAENVKNAKQNGKDTYSVNNYRGTDKEDSSVLFYDEVTGADGETKRVLYMARGNTTYFSSVDGASSFEKFVNMNCGKEMFRVEPRIITIAYSDLQNTAEEKDGYPAGTVVRVIMPSGGYEYYIAYDPSKTKTQLKAILDQADKNKSGWWKLKALS